MKNIYIYTVKILRKRDVQVKAGAQTSSCRKARVITARPHTLTNTVATWWSKTEPTGKEKYSIKIDSK